jgi:hypothetical protein
VAVNFGTTIYKFYTIIIMSIVEKMETIIERLNNYCLLDTTQTIVNLDVNKINNNWKGSVFYITTDYKNIYNKEKYNNIKFDILSNNLYIPPHIEFIDDVVKFVEGRYSFSVIRDNGCTNMPFIVYLDQLELLVELFV